MPKEHAPLGKYATVYRQMIAKCKSGFVFTEYGDERHSLQAIYDYAYVIAAKLIDDGATRKHVAIVGRNDFISVASLFAAIMTGNPAVCIDTEVPTHYRQIDEIDAEVVIVNMDRMVQDVDLSEYSKVTTIYTIGSTGHSIVSELDKTHIEGNFKPPPII